MFDIVSKLFDRLVKTEQGCLEFTGALDTSGYGIVWYEGRNKGAHIITYEYYKGPINGLRVLHHCDNPCCCNIDHLFLGTAVDNYNDMLAKGREIILKGEEIGNSKLNEDNVREIRRLVEEGHTHRYLGELFGVSHKQIGSVARRESWKHVE